MKYQAPFFATDPNAVYVNGNEAIGIEGSTPPAAAFEHHQRELVHLIAWAVANPAARAAMDNGIPLGAPAETDLQQVRKAVEALAVDQTEALNVVGGRVERWDTAGTYNWTVPAGVTRIRVRMWAGGGGGGGSSSTSYGASGGGGGEFREGEFAVTPGDIHTIVVGAAGSSGTAGGGNGTNGGSSTVSSLVTAVGGGGGLGAVSSSPVTSGAGGAGGSGGRGIPGRLGGRAFATPFGLVGGFGGGSFGTSISGPNEQAAGQAGLYPGGGGSGSSANAIGGAGAHGLVEIHY